MDQELPILNGNFLNRLFLGFMFKLTLRFKESLPTQSNLLSLPQELDPVKNYHMFQEMWAKAEQKDKKHFMRALLKCYWLQFLIPCIAFGLSQICYSVSPIFIKWLLDWIQEDDKDFSLGLLYVGIFWGNLFFSSFMLEFGTSTTIILMTHIKQALLLFLYKKIIKLDCVELNKEIGNFLSVVGSDLEFLENSCVFLRLPTFPIFWGIGGIVIYLLSGYPGLIGLAIIFLEVFCVFINNSIIRKRRRTIGRCTGQRISIIHSIIESLRVIKLYAWEDPFTQQAVNLRNTESKGYRSKIAYETINRTLNLAGLGVALIVMIGIQLQIGDSLELGSTTATIITLLIMHNISSRTFVYSLDNLTALQSAFERYYRLVALPERYDQRKQSKDYVVELNNITASWNKDPFDSPIDTNQSLIQNNFLLLDINLKVKKGDLIIVGGEVGSGKSSLLQVIMGEMKIFSGEIFAPKQISYVSQNPWILAGTIRQNILMDKEFDEDKYNNVLVQSQLIHDLQIMSYGDRTTVGENGSNLSGGQRARIALARAMYRDCDLYLLDDPLNAVDANVCQRIFQFGINRFLRSKSRVFVTHHEEFFPYADQLIIMQEGRMEFQGTYAEFSKNPFVKLNSNKDQQDAGQLNTDQAIARSRTIPDVKVSKLVPFKVYIDHIRRGFGGYFILILFLLLYFIGQVIYLGILWWTSYWVSQDEDDQTDNFYMIVFSCIVFATFVIGFLRSYFLTAALQNSTKILHNLAINNLIRTKTKFIDKTSSGQIMNKFTKDIVIGDEYLPMLYTELTYCIITLIGNLIFFAIADVNTSFSILLFGVFFFLQFKYCIRPSLELKKVDAAAKAQIVTSFANALDGLLNIRAMHFQDFLRAKLVQNIYNQSQTYLHYMLMTIFPSLYCQIANSVVIFAVVFSMVFQEDQNPANNATKLMLCLNLVTTLIILVKFIQELISNMVSIENLTMFQSLKPEQTQKQTQQTALTQRTNNNKILPESEVLTAAINDFQICKGEIEFENVYFKYSSLSKNILRRVSFQIPGQAKVGVIGRTGSGKSTIIQCLFRMYPIQKGKILIDGFDVKDIELSVLRSQMSIIPQTPTIFSGTIRSNLDPLSLYNDDHLIWALSQVKLQNKQLDSQADLSIGQSQLLCLARAVLRHSKIIILDEATANIDFNNDKLIQKVIREQFIDSTTITIAHRLRTIADNDFILCLDKGRVSDFNKPKRLLEDKSSLYYQLVSGLEEKERSKVYRMANLNY